MYWPSSIENSRLTATKIVVLGPPPRDRMGFFIKKAVSVLRPDITDWGQHFVDETICFDFLVRGAKFHLQLYWAVPSTLPARQGAWIRAQERLLTAQGLLFLIDNGPEVVWMSEAGYDVFNHAIKGIARKDLLPVVFQCIRLGDELGELKEKFAWEHGSRKFLAGGPLVTPSNTLLELLAMIHKPG